LSDNHLQIFTMLGLLLSLIWILIMLFSYAGTVKYAANSLRIRNVSWRHSVLFGLMLAGLMIVAKLITLTFGQTLSLVWGMLLGLMEFVVIGGWFFSTRASAADGNMLGWLGAMKLSGLSWLFFVALAIMLYGILHVLTL